MKKVIAANWKNNCSKDFINKYFSFFNANIKINQKSKKEIIFFPPDLYLDLVSQSIKDLSGINYGCQNLNINENNTTLTGGSTSAMLEDMNCDYVIIGHSETRENEFNKSLKSKILLCKKMNIIFCVGENSLERQNNQTLKKIFSQLDELIESYFDNMSIIIAYEPVWAIGSGETPTLSNISQTHKSIKKYIIQKLPSIKENDIIVLYGGSVTEKNAGSILKTDFVDGVLVGGASLMAEEFTKICNIEF